MTTQNFPAHAHTWTTDENAPCIYCTQCGATLSDLERAAIVEEQ